MTAEDIYRQLLDHGDEIGLATVYRVLTQFEAAGLVLKHNFEGGQAVYELDRGDHHDHMVDIDTGKVIEFQSAEIEELQRKIAAQARLRDRGARAGAVRAQEGADDSASAAVATRRSALGYASRGLAVYSTSASSRFAAARASRADLDAAEHPRQFLLALPSRPARAPRSGSRLRWRPC